MRLSEDVIRYMTVKQEGPLPAPGLLTSVTQKDDNENREAKDEAKKNNQLRR